MIMKKTLRKRMLALFAAVCMCVPAAATAGQADSPVAVTAVAEQSPYGSYYVIDHNGVVCTANMATLNKGNMMWFPESMLTSSQELPVIVWANGTMCAPALYYEFLSQVAAAGYIVVTNTELFAGNGQEQKASIDFILGEDTDPDSVFYGKIDEAHVGVMGHSQGGMSSVNCANLDNRVDCVFSIAGNSSKSSASKLKVPTFFATGDRDLIVPSWQYVKPSYQACKAPAVYGNVRSAMHTTVCSNPSVYSKYAIKWFDAYLKGGSKAAFRSGGELFRDSDWSNVASKKI
jgi:hypothetical protein